MCIRDRTHPLNLGESLPRTVHTLEIRSELQKSGKPVFQDAQPNTAKTDRYDQKGESSQRHSGVGLKLGGEYPQGGSPTKQTSRKSHDHTHTGRVQAEVHRTSLPTPYLSGSEISSRLSQGELHFTSSPRKASSVTLNRSQYDTAARRNSDGCSVVELDLSLIHI